MILQGDTIRLDTATITDGQVIKRVSGVWINSAGATGTASVDSLKWNASNGYLRWYISGSAADSVLLDDRYVEISDSTVVFVTPTQLAEALVDVQTVVYSIKLPAAGTVASRIAGAVEGTDYPTGWVLSAGTSPVDIEIDHGISRRVASVTIFAIDGTEEQQLFNTAAYNGIKTTDIDTLLVQSLATINKAIKIYIVFV